MKKNKQAIKKLVDNTALQEKYNYVNRQSFICRSDLSAWFYDNAGTYRIINIETLTKNSELDEKLIVWYVKEGTCD